MKLFTFAYATIKTFFSYTYVQFFVKKNVERMTTTLSGYDRKYQLSQQVV